jgi:hypothetical protein
MCGRKIVPSPIVLEQVVPALEKLSVQISAEPQDKRFQGIRVLCFVKREPTAAEYKVLMEQMMGRTWIPCLSHWALQDITLRVLASSDHA